MLHKERWGASANAAEVVRFTAGAGASIRYENSFGEFETRLALASCCGMCRAVRNAARGHDGDRYAVVSVAGGDGLAWVSVWDTPLDAEEFAEHSASARAAVQGKVVVTTGT